MRGAMLSPPRSLLLTLAVLAVFSLAALLPMASAASLESREATLKSRMEAIARLMQQEKQSVSLLAAAQQRRGTVTTASSSQSRSSQSRSSQSRSSQSRYGADTDAECRWVNRQGLYVDDFELDEEGEAAAGLAYQALPLAKVFPTLAQNAQDQGLALGTGGVAGVIQHPRRQLDQMNEVDVRWNFDICVRVRRRLGGAGSAEDALAEGPETSNGQRTAGPGIDVTYKYRVAAIVPGPEADAAHRPGASGHKATISCFRRIAQSCNRTDANFQHPPAEWDPETHRDRARNDTSPPVKKCLVPDEEYQSGFFDCSRLRCMCACPTAVQKLDHFKIVGPTRAGRCCDSTEVHYTACRDNKLLFAFEEVNVTVSPSPAAQRNLSRGQGLLGARWGGPYGLLKGSAGRGQFADGVVAKMAFPIATKEILVPGGINDPRYSSGQCVVSACDSWPANYGDDSIHHFWKPFDTRGARPDHWGGRHQTPITNNTDARSGAPFLPPMRLAQTCHDFVVLKIADNGTAVPPGTAHCPACAACPDGEFLEWGVSDACQPFSPCPPGSFRVDTSPASGGRCEVCPVGSFKPSWGLAADTCDELPPCGPGHARRNMTASSAGGCMPCAPGTHKAGAGSYHTRCQPCAPGTFAKDGGMSACKPHTNCTSSSTGIGGGGSGSGAVVDAHARTTVAGTATHDARCGCEAGYAPSKGMGLRIGNGGRCERIDRCAVSTTASPRSPPSTTDAAAVESACSKPHAECVDTHHGGLENNDTRTAADDAAGGLASGFSCQCKPGYYGSGYKSLPSMMELLLRRIQSNASAGETAASRCNPSGARFLCVTGADSRLVGQYVEDGTSPRAPGATTGPAPRRYLKCGGSAGGDGRDASSSIMRNKDTGAWEVRFDGRPWYSLAANATAAAAGSSAVDAPTTTTPGRDQAGGAGAGSPAWPAILGNHYPGGPDPDAATATVTAGLCHNTSECACAPELFRPEDLDAMAAGHAGGTFMVDAGCQPFQQCVGEGQLLVREGSTYGDTTCTCAEGFTMGRNPQEKHVDGKFLCVTGGDSRVNGLYKEDVASRDVRAKRTGGGNGDSGDSDGGGGGGDGGPAWGGKKVFERDGVSRYLKCNDEYVSIRRVLKETPVSQADPDGIWRVDYGPAVFYQIEANDNAPPLGKWDAFPGSFFVDPARPTVNIARGLCPATMANSYGHDPDLHCHALASGARRSPDPTCRPCAECDGRDEYAKQACNATHNTVCAPTHDCTRIRGQVAVRPSSPVSDTCCGCEPHFRAVLAPGQDPCRPTCEPVDVCELGKDYHDCDKRAECALVEPRPPPSSSSLNSSNTHTCTCREGYFGDGRRNSSTSATGRGCTKARRCNRRGEVQVAPANGTQDAVCGCADGYFMDASAQRCRAWTECDCRRTFELSAPNATHDRVCGTVTACDASRGETERMPPSCTSNRACSPAPSTTTLSIDVRDALDNRPLDGALVSVARPSGSSSSSSSSSSATGGGGALLLGSVTTVAGVARVQIPTSFTAPDTTVALNVSLTGYVALFNLRHIVHSPGSGATTAPAYVSLSKTGPPGRVRIVSTWGAAPKDLDSHLLTPRPLSQTSADAAFGQIYFAHRCDCSPSCLPAGSCPATLDLDNIGYRASDAGKPETITIDCAREPGRYRFLLQDYMNGRDGPFDASHRQDASNDEPTVRLYQGGALVQTFTFSEGKAQGHFYDKSKRADILRQSTRRQKVKPRWYVFQFTCSGGGEAGQQLPLRVEPWSDAEPAEVVPTRA